LSEGTGAHISIGERQLFLLAIAKFKTLLAMSGSSGCQMNTRVQAFCVPIEPLVRWLQPVSCFPTHQKHIIAAS